MLPPVPPLRPAPTHVAAGEVDGTPSRLQLQVGELPPSSALIKAGEELARGGQRERQLPSIHWCIGYSLPPPITTEALGASANNKDRVWAEGQLFPHPHPPPVVAQYPLGQRAADPARDLGTVCVPAAGDSRVLAHNVNLQQVPSLLSEAPRAGETCLLSHSHWVVRSESGSKASSFPHPL